jgi:hypothetical protein
MIPPKDRQQIAPIVVAATVALSFISILDGSRPEKVLEDLKKELRKS